MVSLNNNERQVRNMGVLTLFDDLKVIYVFNYRHEAPVCVCVFFFVTDFTAAQQDFKYLYFIFSCTCPMTIYTQTMQTKMCLVKRLRNSFITVLISVGNEAALSNTLQACSLAVSNCADCNHELLFNTCVATVVTTDESLHFSRNEQKQKLSSSIVQRGKHLYK